MSEQQSFERATYRKYDFSEKQGLGHLIQRYIIQYKESVAKNINWTKLKKKKKYSETAKRKHLNWENDALRVL